MVRLLEGKTALITGGGTGIGQEIALQFAAAGARIAITYRTHEPDVEFVSRIEQEVVPGLVEVEVAVPRLTAAVG